MKVHISLFPQEIIDKYTVMEHVNEHKFVCMEITGELLYMGSHKAKWLNYQQGFLEAPQPIWVLPHKKNTIIM